MVRHLWIAGVFLLMTGAQAQEWARKMFVETEHDFGVVARSAKTEFAFTFRNPYVEDVRVASVRSSCGCTSVRVERPLVKTHETSAIIATYNTHLFTGRKGATITVTFDKPYFAEVQLHVTGVIRSDVVLEPGAISLGSVAQGAGGQGRAVLSCYNRSAGKVDCERRLPPYLSVEIAPRPGQALPKIFDIVAQLSPDAPVGYIRDTITLRTDDGTTIPLVVEGKVEPAISVNPCPLFFGLCPANSTSVKQLIVKSAVPIRIVAAEASNSAITVDIQSAAVPKSLHIVPVRFAAGADPVELNATLTLRTDAAGQSSIDVPVFVKVGP